VGDLEANGVVTDPSEPSWSYRPLQSLARQRSSEPIRLPAPGSASALAERPALPVFLPPPAPKDATPWAILSWGSALLHGVTRNLRPRSFDRGHLSWGSVAPTTLEEERVHVPPRLPASGSLVVPGGSPTSSHLAGYGAAHRFSQPLSGLLPLPTVPPFSDGWRSWGCALQGISFHEASTTRRRRHALLTFLPSSWP
jgi:hypothetical protein